MYECIYVYIYIYIYDIYVYIMIYIYIYECIYIYIYMICMYECGEQDVVKMMRESRDADEVGSQHLLFLIQ